MLWLTSTLSTLSRLISKVRRLMNPVLCTTRMLVTSVSVVQRWNQTFAVMNSAAIATTTEDARHARTRLSTVVMRDITSSTRATIQTAIAGKKNTQCALVEYSTFSPGCRILSI